MPTDRGLNEQAGPSSLTKLSVVPREVKPSTTSVEASTNEKRKTGQISQFSVHSEQSSAKKRKRTTEVEPKRTRPSISESELDLGASSELSEDEKSDASLDGDLPKHETLTTLKSKRKRNTSTKVKYTPEGETLETRDARTIFLGNLPVVVVKSKV